jgi:hypothetical protein
MCSDYAIFLVAFGLDSPLPRRDQLLLRLGKRLKKSVSVYMCLCLCYPFHGKSLIRILTKSKIKKKEEKELGVGAYITGSLLTKPSWQAPRVLLLLLT